MGGGDGEGEAQLYMQGSLGVHRTGQSTDRAGADRAVVGEAGRGLLSLRPPSPAACLPYGTSPFTHYSPFTDSLTNSPLTGSHSLTLAAMYGDNRNRSFATQYDGYIYIYIYIYMPAAVATGRAKTSAEGPIEGDERATGRRPGGEKERERREQVGEL